MIDRENDKIDLNQLSQKELLVRLVDQVSIIRKELDEYGHDFVKFKVRLAVLETKAAIYGGISGAVIGIMIRLLS